MQSSSSLRKSGSNVNLKNLIDRNIDLSCNDNGDDNGRDSNDDIKGADLMV
jgi:hypothetical protein